MCRMAYIPNAGIPLEMLAELFAYLERTQGGYGNGYSQVVHNPLETRYKKGFDLQTEEIALLATAGGLMFHSRIPSVGAADIIDNLQPFPVRYEDSESAFSAFLAHNGTWYEYKDWIPYLLGKSDVSIKDLQQYSDSRIMAALMNVSGPDNFFGFLDIPDSGIWLVHKEYSLHFYAHSGDWSVCSTPYGFVYASDFPLDWYSKYVIQQFPPGSIGYIDALNTGSAIDAQIKFQIGELKEQIPVYSPSLSKKERKRLRKGGISYFEDTLYQFRHNY